MHKIKVQSVTFKMPYLEANKTKLFLRVGKQFSNTTIEHLFFNHTELRRYVLSSYRAKNKGKQKMRVWNALFWNATPRNATGGLREKTKKKSQNFTLHSYRFENILNLIGVQSLIAKQCKHWRLEWSNHNLNHKQLTFISICSFARFNSW